VRFSPYDRFAGRHVLVTGAASGIGQATALELAHRGARLSLADIDGAGVRATADRARALGSDAFPYEVDMARADLVDALAARTLRERGPVDVLLNNAGVAVVAPFLQTSAADWEWVQAVNVWGPIRLTRAILPSMLERRSGQVVMVASLAGLVGAPGLVAYGTTKFALVGFAEGLRLEVAEAGVSVTVVCPGFVRTNFASASRYKNRDFRRFLHEPPSWYGLSKEAVAARVADAIAAHAPMLVLGPEKVAWWLKRLAPDAAFTVTRWAARWAGIGAGAGVASGTPTDSPASVSSRHETANGGLP
jgi:NAD(P)-dependent dehydrogenase (short-subunit alcohol dehydrogenase family)